ncbi:hypothetical protein JW935_06645, partial [candidate division KSB1 bacterium]|nr:hypothetical protein [candidate division KSB1 bacterium]
MKKENGEKPLNWHFNCFLICFFLILMQASGGEISGRIYDKTGGEPILLANFKIYQAYGEYDDANKVSAYMKKIMPATLFTPTSSPMIYRLHFRHVL